MNTIKKLSKGKAYSEIICGLDKNPNKWEDMGYMEDGYINKCADNLLIALERIKCDEDSIIYEMDEMFRSIWEETLYIAVDYEDTVIHAILLWAVGKIDSMTESYEKEVIV